MDKETRSETQVAKQLEGNGCLSVSERTDNFIRHLSKLKNEIEHNLLKSEQLENRENLPSQLNRINEDFQKLQRYVADATMYLPMYNVRVAQETLKQLQEEMFITQNRVLPKKKFAFKNKKIQSSSKDLVDSSKSSQRKDLNIDFFECGYKNLQNQVLEKQEEEINGKDVGLHSLEKCVVRISGFANTVHLSQLKECQIFLGPVSTSVFIENCSQCVLVVACQQLRVHSTTDCTVYLHVTSKAIIEDCSNLQFAPYIWSYDGIDAHFKLSGLDPQRNNWDDVDDFNWLSKDAPSPNWCIMPVEQRLRTFS